MFARLFKDIQELISASGKTKIIGPGSDVTPIPPPPPPLPASTLWSWGDNANGRTALGLDSGSTVDPTQVNVADGPIWHNPNCGFNFSGVVRDDRRILQAGDNSNGRTGQGVDTGDTLTLSQIVGNNFYLDLACGSSHVIALRFNNGLYSWGDNSNGRTGLGTGTGDTLTPTQVGSDTDWESITAGGGFCFAIKENGTMYSWGVNSNGRTGQGTASGNTLVPTQVGSATTWAMAAASMNNFGIALRTDGTLWSWGSNANGRTAQGTTSGNTLSPTQVGSDTDWAFCYAANNHAVAVKSNGTIWSWGTNANGSTGLGTSTGDTTTPTQIGTDTDWDQGRGGANCNVATKTNGEMWAWGVNFNGRTALGTTSGSTLSPTQVGSDTDWFRVAMGGQHGMAIKNYV